jgi:hypothetical protein
VVSNSKKIEGKRWRLKKLVVLERRVLTTFSRPKPLVVSLHELSVLKGSILLFVLILLVIREAKKEILKKKS